MLSLSKHLCCTRQNIYTEPVKTFMLSPSKYAKKNLRNLLHLRKSARRFATTNRAEVKGEAFAKISSVVALQARSDKRKSESLGGKSNRVESANFYAIRFFFYAIPYFFSDEVYGI
jgi:hypothetical protein